MGLLSKSQKFEALDQLIRLRRTGTAQDLANHLDLSKRTIYAMLDELRDYGADLKWNDKLNSYIYRNNFRIKGIEITCD